MPARVLPGASQVVLPAAQKKVERRPRDPKAGSSSMQGVALPRER